MHKFKFSVLKKNTLFSLIGIVQNFSQTSMDLVVSGDYVRTSAIIGPVELCLSSRDETRMERHFTVEAKAFFFPLKASQLHLEERQKGYLGLILVGLRSASWLATTVEEASRSPVLEGFIKSSCEGRKSVSVRGGCNKVGRFLEVVAFVDDERKVTIWIPEACSRRGWRKFVVELRSFVAAMESSPGSSSKVSLPEEKNRGSAEALQSPRKSDRSFAEALRSLLAKWRIQMGQSASRRRRSISSQWRAASRWGLMERLSVLRGIGSIWSLAHRRLFR
jgi:hypothetical protein